jgi:SAM-dependent methyltransferase
VLDLGCANGEIAAILASRGYHVIGVERPDGVGSAFPHNTVALVLGDLDSGIPPLAGPFDYVLCADILEHLKHPARLLQEIHSLLAPAAVLVASLPNSGNVYFRLNVLVGRFPQDDKGLFDRTHLHFYMWDGWVRLFSGAGFRVEVVKPTGIPVGLALPGLAGSALVRCAEFLSFQLARLWKTLFAYQFVVTARKGVPQ